MLSPLLSNVYLDALDHLMAQRGYEMVRYADDFVILCRTREEAEAALALVQSWVAEAKLTLHPEKTRIVDVRETSFRFSGLQIPEASTLPTEEELGKVRQWSLKLPRLFFRGKRRCFRNL